MSGAPHAPLAPSSAYRWVHCPGSVPLTLQYPDTGGTDAAGEGTQAHAIAAERLRGNEAPAPNAEMDRAVAAYVRDVGQVAGHAVVEKRLEMPAIHPDNWGTCDALKRDNEGRIAYLWDFKYGHGFVDAFENWQLLEYAVGVTDRIGPDAPTWSFVLTVVQPRAYHHEGPVRRWRLSASELQRYARKLREAAEEAMGNNPRTVPGPYCKHCPARHACKALRLTTLDTVDMLADATPVDLSPDGLGLELGLLTRAAEQLEARLAGLQAQALAAIQSGAIVPGWGIGRTRGGTEWTRPAQEVLVLGELYGAPLGKPLAPITPKQAMDAGIPADVVAAYSQKTPGKAILVPITTDDARRAFGG